MLHCTVDFADAIEKFGGLCFFPAAVDNTQIYLGPECMCY